MEPSKSTDKLVLITELISKLPPERLAKVKSIDVNWRQVEKDTVVPVLNIIFFE